MSDKSDSPHAITASARSPTSPVSLRDASPKIDKKVKNFSARLKARARAEAIKEGTYDPKNDTGSRPGSSASTVRPDSVLSFREEIPMSKQSDFSAFRPESTSMLPPDTVTTIRPDSVAAVHAAGQSVFRPFQPPSGPTARLTVQCASNPETDWEARDEMRQRELEEMRARASQMEKTMRWWSDCTANWREKWSKVRNERNKVREDYRQLRSKLEVVVKECTSLKREKQELATEVDKLKTELELHQTKDPDKDSDSLSTSSSTSVKSQPEDSQWSEDACSNRSKLTKSMAEAKIEELTSMVTAEKEEKEILRNQYDNLKSQLLSAQSSVTELKSTNMSLSDQIKILQENTTPEISSDNERTHQQITNLRQQLERLQTENAAEWAKRERLQSDKSSLERENKRLRTLVDELQEQVASRTTSLVSSQDNNIKSLQTDLIHKTKEFNELKQQFTRIKQQQSETQTELEHSTRRSEQYQTEVRQLRARIEELKDQLLTAENELDSQSNSIRKLTRQCEDLKLGSENYESQNSHLKTRAPDTFV